MKNFFLIILLLSITSASLKIHAQGVAISDSAGYLPDSSAMLDVMSVSKGLLPPRVTTSDRDAIGNPAEGLVIFNTSTRSLEVFDGERWRSPTAAFNCGTSQVLKSSGNYYNTIKMGSRCWMASNLNAGTRVDGTVNQTDNGIVEKYCYNNSEDSCTKYGGLYQWDEIMNYNTANGSQGICPEGWHIPTDEEWCMLESELDLTVDCTTTGWRGTDIGMKLMTGGSSGFDAPLIGYRSSDGNFYQYDVGVYQWTSTVQSSRAWIRHLDIGSGQSAKGSELWHNGFSVRCVKDVASPPSVINGTASDITKTTAMVTGEITDLGRSEIIQHGHCWSTSSGPTLEDDLYNTGTTNSTGTFTSQLNRLNPGTTYYVRAYALNEQGLTYSDEISFMTGGSGGPCPGLPTITYGSQVYNTIQFGSQCWMKENLNIGSMTNGSSDQSNNGTIEKYCYDNNLNNCNTYGGLYQWDEMMQYSTTEGVQGICPPGWHIPTDAEWCILEQEIDSGVICESTSWRGLDAGMKMKTGGSSGFDALMGGMRQTYGTYFTAVTFSGYFWTSTEFNSFESYFRRFNTSYHTVERNDRSKSEGRSVRCVKD
jgi:uncharacterized protein (TIGR02145 family)